MLPSPLDAPAKSLASRPRSVSPYNTPGVGAYETTTERVMKHAPAFGFTKSPAVAKIRDNGVPGAAKYSPTAEASSDRAIT